MPCTNKMWSCWMSWWCKSLTYLNLWRRSSTCKARRIASKDASGDRSRLSLPMYSNPSSRILLVAWVSAPRHKTITPQQYPLMQDQGRPSIPTSVSKPKTWFSRLRQVSSKETSWERLTSTSKWENSQRRKASCLRLAKPSRDSISVRGSSMITSPVPWLWTD